jgi:hypothetical protein
MYSSSVLKSMLGQATTGVIPRDLLTTDRIMQRWSVANGSGLPTERWDDSRVARVPPLDDDTALLVDQIVLRCPPKTHKVIVQWYCRPLPTVEIARSLKMSPRSLEKSWLLSLNFLKYKFEGTNHLTLLKLLRVHV